MIKKDHYIVNEKGRLSRTVFEFDYSELVMKAYSDAGEADLMKPTNTSGSISIGITKSQAKELKTKGKGKKFLAGEAKEIADKHIKDALEKGK